MIETRHLKNVVIFFQSIAFPSKYNFVLIIFKYWIHIPQTQPTFTCSKLTIETLEEGVKYIQS